RIQLISEPEGGISGEFSHMSSREPTRVSLGDGTVLSVQYNKPGRPIGVWAISLETSGALFVRIDEYAGDCAGQHYSDIAWFEDGITEARCDANDGLSES